MIEVNFEIEKTGDAETQLQDLLDELHEVGILKMKGTVKTAKTNVGPYSRNTFEVSVEFDE